MHFPFSKILCPVGFDDQEGAALDAAKQLAGGVATVYLLHVVPSWPTIGEPHVVKTAEEEKPAEAKALKMLKELAAQRLLGLKCETLTETAFLTDTSKAILTVAREIKPDLIVMPTHGRSGSNPSHLGKRDRGRRARGSLPRAHDKAVGELGTRGLEISEMRRLRQLEEENRRLKSIVADQALDIRALKDALDHQTFDQPFIFMSRGGTKSWVKVANVERSQIGVSENNFTEIGHAPQIFAPTH